MLASLDASVVHVISAIMSNARIVPPNRNRRILWIVILGAMITGGLILTFQALNQNTQFFENPSEVVATGFQPRSVVFKIGGLVAENSVETDGLTTSFLIKDFEREMTNDLSVTYSGALPDLFREGQGVVVSGQLISATRFQATEVLAKHDENYQPKINYRDDKTYP